MPSATPSAWMPLRTRALAALLRATSGPVDTISPARLARTRRRVPLHRPLTWAIGTPTKGVTTTVREVPVRDGARVRVRVHRPDYVEGALPVVMHFHGGGFAMGHPTAFDPVCTRVAQVAGAVVVSVGYRMAPEHRAPTAVHDCADVTRWVLAHAAELGADPDRLALTGDSAGGNLAAAVAQGLVADGVSALRHLALTYPAPDLTEREVDLVLEQEDVEVPPHGFPVITPDMLRAFRSLYLGDLDGSDPIVSPARGELAGLPPTLVQTAELDPLRLDGEAFAQALRDAGVPVRHTRYRGSPHGFLSLPGLTAAGHPALEELAAEMAHHLRPTKEPA
ncbi:alpha/beta hydrolase fold domain-containing protein [Janibacter melonis]|uniref:Alpha/beta hydrolase fold domain-containing protein n=3 Tax=Janibacter melonis TaxID=262209 RepID=A0A176QBP2_9MICO|nr:alpha/beta hydrolase [Janibacter melonis]MCB5990176.1 alpha/beta hydrolase [Janibacter melonis]MCM3554565.1 alpha/beta hydrolase [Janibacter melonis]OAB87077.1 hypothetical protein AWH69_11940 [Janibacter melonis]QFQ30179.1 alpha/beta hydrolase fold domain-containing protein [Janibacter melonis]